jgi:Domain of unknown function (DUF4177)
MAGTYEYKFVRLEQSRFWWTGPSREVLATYQDVVREQARDGWRLIQIFAPGVGPHGAADYFGLILEREALGPSA